MLSSSQETALPQNHIYLRVNADSKVGREGAAPPAGAPFPVLPWPWLITTPLERQKHSADTAPDCNTNLNFTQTVHKRHSHIYSSHCKYHRNLCRSHLMANEQRGTSLPGSLSEVSRKREGSRLLPSTQRLLFPMQQRQRRKIKASRRRCQGKKLSSEQNTSPKRWWEMRKGSIFLQWKILEHEHSLECPYQTSSSHFSCSNLIFFH